MPGEPWLDSSAWTVSVIWIPFLPVSLPQNDGNVALELAQAIDPTTRQPILPRGRILQPTARSGSAPYQIPEEEERVKPVDPIRVLDLIDHHD